MDKQNTIQHSASNDKHVQFKSKAVVRVSTVQTPNFIRHKVNTNLNLKPQNFFSLEAESFGVRFTSSGFYGFSSFQMASMIPECIGKVDIVSDAENIKNLCKIPYDNKSVSIMVHKIDKTLLLDEFDVEKHLIQDRSEKWVWLKKFFYNNIVKSSDIKVKCITYKNNDLKKIQNKNLVSKFLHHSIGLDSNNEQMKDFHDNNSPLTSPLQKLTPKEAFHCPQIKQLFNRNILWDFEDMQMLIGTDLPIFRSGNNSYLSTRLRDMSKSLSMLTGIDYWLENVMCNIPEIEFCYHKNGIVQKYEMIKTEEIPYLNDSTFSPNDISDIMQNIISFLKSNANNDGHTYWLFKGKNNNAVKLYDLTKLCSESLIDNPNPFTVPVAILLYRVACKLKHNSKDNKPCNPVTIQFLLNDCLKLLDKTKYPEVVISVNNLLSDMYISIYNNPSTTAIDSTEVDKDDFDHCYDDYAISSTSFDYGTYSVDIQNLCVSHKKEIISQIPEHFMAKHLVKTIEECYYKALYYVGNSLSCLQYFKNDKNIMVGRSSLFEDKTNPLQNINSEIFGKNDIQSWHNLLNPGDDNWENDLRLSFYKKASDVYFNLGKNCLASKNFGIALKCFRRSFECELCVNNNTDVNHLFGSILDLCANCCMFILKNWNKLEQYINELGNNDMYDFELRKALLNNYDHNNKDLNLIPIILNNSKESILSAAEHCYLRALELEKNINNTNNLSKQIGIVYIEYIKMYTVEIIMAIIHNIPVSPLKIKLFIKNSKHFFTLGSDIFKKIEDEDNFLLINLNLANFYKHITHYSTKYIVPIYEFIKKEIFNYKIGNAYKKRLSDLGDRSSNPQLWDEIYYQLSSSLFYVAVHAYLDICRCTSNNYRECINLFMEALNYCDLENCSPNRFVYEYQTAYIYLGLATLSSNRLEKYITKKSPEVRPVFTQIMSYCNVAFEIYFKIRRPLESFEVLVKMIILDMRFIDGMPSLQNIKHVISILRTLRKCDIVFQMFSENKNTIKYSQSIGQPEELAIKDDLHFEMRKLHFFLILEENVLKLLKYMIQLALYKSPSMQLKWLTNKENELKTIHSLLLRHKIDENGYSQLMIAVKHLSTFN